MRPALAGMTVLLIAAPAFADGPARSQRAAISANVPVHCAVDSGPLQLPAAAEPVEDTVTEFCNTARGFEIVASYRPLADGETASVTYGGTSIALDPGGSVSLAVRSTGAYGTQPISISGDGLVDALTISLHANPL